MSDDYNSILKEKKVYEDVSSSNNSLFFKFIILGLFFSFIVIAISYSVYYNSILSGESILLNNSLKIINQYGVITKGFYNNYNLSNNYTLNGNVSVNDFNYQYKFMKDGSKIEKNINYNDSFIKYYFDSDSSYIKLSSLSDKYISFNNELLSMDSYIKDYDTIIKLGFNNYLESLFVDSSPINVFNRLYTIDNYSNIFDNIKSNFSNYIVESNYKKKFYFYNGRPVIKIDLFIDKEGINKILGDGNNNLVVKDDISISITTRNDAIINDIKNIKIVINNNTKKTREVILYDGSDIIYVSDNGVKYRYSIGKDKNRDILKVFKDDVLYSTLEGYSKDNKYIYNYQVIDKVMKIGVEVSNDNNKYSYSFVINDEDKVYKARIDGVYDNTSFVDNNISNVVSYRNISDSDRSIINSSIKNIFNGM